MTEYRRAHVPGAAWLFTVNLAERKGNRLLVERIERGLHPVYKVRISAQRDRAFLQNRDPV